MKKINLVGLDSICYKEVLDNGLEVFMFPMEGKKNYYMSYATRFGSVVTDFLDSDGKKVSVPDGIAHFLEHKMFESEDGVDPFSFYAESGTNANASTFYDFTDYICYGTKNFSNNLEYLIKYVNSPYLTDENVEKEKGIIAEELKMYNDMPDHKLDIVLRKNLYHTDNRRVDIGGTVDEIMKITKEDLYNCYNNFYAPSNMFLMIVGNFDKDEALKIINDSTKYITLKKKGKFIEGSEKDSVVKKHEVIFGNVLVPMISAGLKISLNKLPKMSDLELDLYLNMITTLNIGNSSIFRENVRNMKLINNFYYYIENTDKFRVLYINSSTDNPVSLEKELSKVLDNLVVLEEEFNRMKKVWIANEVKVMDDVSLVVDNMFDDIVKYKDVVPNKLDIIRGLSMDTVKKIIKGIDSSNKSICVMMPEEK